MTRAVRIRFCLLAAVTLGAPLPAAMAQQTARAPAIPAAPASPATLPQDSPTNEPKTREQLEAQQHFQRAKDLYQTGAYREAIAELEQARGLDPKAKDLVFNLGIVHEKLGKFDEAITFFRQYMEMEAVTAGERAKAETIIKRIEGARREIPVAPTATANGAGAGASTGASDPPPPSPPPQDTRPGRIDAATITAGSIAIVGLGVGTAFGILAAANKPSANEFTTGRDGSYDTLKAKADDAHSQAVVADIGFGIGIAAAVVTAYLYFGRTREPKAVEQARAFGILPSATPVASGGGVMTLGGSFR